jgi:hypothetical protein
MRSTQGCGAAAAAISMFALLNVALVRVHADQARTCKWWRGYVQGWGKGDMQVHCRALQIRFVSLRIWFWNTIEFDEGGKGNVVNQSRRSFTMGIIGKRVQ